MNKNISITYTVRNESRLLPLAIQYHKAIGCDHFFVFFDGTTDNTRELVSNIEGVILFETLKPEALENFPDWIIDLLPWWETNMDVRKAINTYKAAKIANSMDIEWIACIDPDELIHPLQKNEKVDDQIFSEFLNNIPEKYNQILLRNLELIPSDSEINNPFKSNCLFLNRFPTTEYIFRISSGIFRRIFKNPKLHAWFNYCFYQIRFPFALRRLMFDPISKSKIPASYYLGYYNHKSILRTKDYAELKFGIHKWEKFTKSPKSIYKGKLLHYDLFDYRYLQEKFKQRQSSIILEIFYFRYKLAMFARSANETQLKDFFEKFIMISDQKKINSLIKRRIISKIDSVSNFFIENESKSQQIN